LYASNGKEAIEKVKELVIDYVILDLLMPEMTGQEALSIIKQQSRNIPVIVISADIQETTKAECMKLGADAFLNKPPAKNDLLNILKKFES
jgi:twitching motility two-component system response regulator PilH